MLSSLFPLQTCQANNMKENLIMYAVIAARSPPTHPRWYQERLEPHGLQMPTTVLPINGGLIFQSIYEPNRVFQSKAS
jgi:hypothetical protein